MKDLHDMVFALRLKEQRERKNLTQTSLAELLGYKNYTTISKWESGDSIPRGRELKWLAEYFGVTTDYLLGLVDEPKKKHSSDKINDAFVKSITSNNQSYTDLLESLPLLTDEEISIVNSMVQSLIELKQKKS